jgi:hypothetical protein
MATGGLSYFHCTFDTISRMISVRSSVARHLLAIPVVLAICVCHFAAAQPATQSHPDPTTPDETATTIPTPTDPAEIHVNRRCRTLSAIGLAVAGTPAKLSANAFCRLESVKTSQHPEKAIANGKPHRILVTVREQDYLLQNLTGEPVVFVVEHLVPRGWQVDSEPQPTTMSGSTAIFRANAEPGQTVRLHVGLKTTRLGPIAPREPIIPGAPDIIRDTPNTL